MRSLDHGDRDLADRIAEDVREERRQDDRDRRDRERRQMVAITYGKSRELQAILEEQVRRPPNRRVCPGTTPAQIVALLRAGYTADQAREIVAADAGKVKDIRALAIECMDLSARTPYGELVRDEVPATGEPKDEGGST